MLSHGKENLLSPVNDSRSVCLRRMLCEGGSGSGVALDVVKNGSNNCINQYIMGQVSGHLIQGTNCFALVVLTSVALEMDLKLSSILH